MKKPTLQQRHDIYVSALEYYKKREKLKRMGLCGAISYCPVNLNYNYPWNAYTNMEMYIEIMQLKPKNCKSMYWWPRNRRRVRIEALKTAIQITQEKLDKKKKP